VDRGSWFVNREPAALALAKDESRHTVHDARFTVVYSPFLARKPIRSTTRFE
jgi:hypothetical protein